MIDMTRLVGAAATLLLLGACATTAIPPATAPVAGPVSTPPRVTQNNALIGHDADSAIRQFGQPRLDVTEGAGRKLQFSGGACTLDVYYYASRQGANPLATHVDARTPDGRNAEVASCIEALRR